MALFSLPERFVAAGRERVAKNPTPQPFWQETPGGVYSARSPNSLLPL
jgi:hypothetical protein